MLCDRNRYIVIEQKLSCGGIFLGGYGAQYSLHVCSNLFVDQCNGFTLALATFPTKENGNLAGEGVHLMHDKLIFRCVI